jgi:hypothetical protein
MSFKPTYAEAKARHVPLKRSGFKSKPGVSTSTGKKASRDLNARKGKPLQRRSGLNRSKQSSAEKVWRNDVLVRDGYQCRWIDSAMDQRCGECGEHVQAHHIQTRKQRPDLLREVNNGAAICSFHHDYLHHDPRGRKEAKAQGLLGGQTYEAAQKQKREQ